MLRVEKLLPTARERLVTIRTDGLLIDAARLLDDPQHNLVVVCDDGGVLAGVITRTDIVRRISHCMGGSCRMAAPQVMTSEVKYCRPTDDLNEVWAVMQEHGLKNIPVVDRDWKPVGVLNVRDALELLLKDLQFEEQLLRDYVMGVGYR